MRHNPEAEILYKNSRWETVVGTSIGSVTQVRYLSLRPIKTAGKTSPAVIEDL